MHPALAPLGERFVAYLSDRWQEPLTLTSSWQVRPPGHVTCMQGRLAYGMCMCMYLTIVMRLHV